MAVRSMCCCWSSASSWSPSGAWRRVGALLPALMPGRSWRSARAAGGGAGGAVRCGGDRLRDRVYLPGRNVWSAKAMVTGVRSFLRYLHVAGLDPGAADGRGPGGGELAGPACPADWPPEQVQAMLAAAIGDRGRAP